MDPRMPGDGAPAAPPMEHGAAPPREHPRELVQKLLAMSEQDIASLAPEQRRRVMMIRDSLLLSEEEIRRMPPPVRDELLAFRAEFHSM
jgi:hypothetical protein